jgi:hypothetical protein
VTLCDESSEHHKASPAKENDKNNDEKEPSGVIGHLKQFFFGDDKSKLIPCRDNVNCLLQYSSRDAADHNAQYSHPCRFSELCHTKEPHLTHEPHRVSMCKNDTKCSHVNDPFHRAEYRHTDLSDFLVPCRDKATCRDKTTSHRIKYSHGEQVYQTDASTEKGKILLY